MDPIQLFHALEHKPLGPALFRLLILGRCRLRSGRIALLERWILLGLPGTRWALRQREALHAHWQRDWSDLRNLHAQLNQHHR